MLRRCLLWRPSVSSRHVTCITFVRSDVDVDVTWSPVPVVGSPVVESGSRIAVVESPGV